MMQFLWFYSWVILAISFSIQNETNHPRNTIGLRHFIFAPHKAGITFLLELFVREVVLGIVVGFAMGYLAYQLLSSFESRLLETHVTLVLVLLINMICKHIGASIPLASVIAGLMIGNYGVEFVISSQKTFHWVSYACTSVLVFNQLVVGFYQRHFE